MAAELGSEDSIKAMLEGNRRNKDIFVRIEGLWFLLKLDNCVVV